MFSKSKISLKGGKALSPELRQAKKEKRSRFWRKAGRRFLWTLAIAFVIHLSLNIYASVQLNRELAAIRQKGDPLRFSEVEPPAVPDALNAAVVYQQASKSLRFSREEKDALRTRRRDVTPAVQKFLHSALSDNEKALALTRQGAAMPQCRFPLNWRGDPTRFRFPYYADLRELARLLALDAKVRAQKGEKEPALRDVRALFGMSHHLSNEPFLIGYLVSQSVNALAHQALGEALESIPLTVGEARALEASLPKDDWTLAFRRSLVGERMMGIFAFENLGQSVPESEGNEDVDYSPPAWASYPLLWLVRPVLKLDEIQTLRMWRLFLDSPQSQQVPLPAGFSRAQNNAIRNVPFYASLTKILFPVFSRTADIRDAAEVRRRQREVALSLACYRSANGHYPIQLQEAAALWGAPLPIDPYSGKNFVYRVQGKSFLLYSLGVNRVDDGGKNSRSISIGVGGNSTADDIVWSNSQAALQER